MGGYSQWEDVIDHRPRRREQMFRASVALSPAALREAERHFPCRRWNATASLIGEFETQEVDSDVLTYLMWVRTHPPSVGPT